MDKNRFLDFVDELKVRTPIFVNKMEVLDFPGKYNFSMTGDIPTTSRHWGLGQSTFAARILYIFDALNGETSQNIADYINTFLKPDGAYYDDYVSNATFVKRMLQGVRHLNPELFFNNLNKRAETRQAIASLINLGEPYGEYSGIGLEEINVRKYFAQLDWSNPWGAGSHVNHLLFFTKYSNVVSQDKKNIIVQDIYENLTVILQKDGFYRCGDTPSTHRKIGGLMKVLMGMSLVGVDERLMKNSFIDLVLDDETAEDACESFNKLYVLYIMGQHVDYRREEIIQYGLKQVAEWMQYYHEGYGAFSFFKNKSGTNYYGARITRGRAEPDIHGTAMFIWGVLLITDLLQESKSVGLKTPVL